MPAICKTLANYTTQMLMTNTSDGSMSDRKNPRSLTLKIDFKNFPITSIKDLGNCEEPKPDAPPLKDAWCQAAGGNPEVYQVETAKAWDAKNIYPAATLIVTYNRGGCSVREVTLK
jgi:hypothetical protein